MKVEIIKFDNLGRGIGYINDKIIFIPKSVPGDIVEAEITKESNKFYEGKIIKIITPSKQRKEAICPYFSLCGGCDLLHISLSDALEYKLNKVNELLKKNKIDYKVDKIIKSDEQYNYRNKVSLKIENGIIGYYENDTHKIIHIDYCYLGSKVINEIIKNLDKLQIKNGSVTIRCNNKEEVLLIINSDDTLENIDWFINNYRIAGIIQNDKCIYGDDYFIMNISKYLFKVSYNSFFQINPYICEKLLNYVHEYTKDAKNIIDLYCGVGSLTIASANQDNKVLGVEIVENAIIDANINQNFNHVTNAQFICADTKDVTNKITSDYDTIILDPPRSGVHPKVINKIINENINKIIYISCDANTLVRDLKLFENKYEIEEFILFDMFPNTYHVESLCILKLH